MNTALGLWMLPCVALLSITGVASWVALIVVSIIFAGLAMMMGATLASFGVLPMRIIGLLEHDLLQALPLYVLMGCVWHRLPLAQHVMHALHVMFYRMGARHSANSLSVLSSAVLFAPINGSVGASVTMLSKLIAARAQPQQLAMMAAFGALGVIVPPSLVLLLLGDAMMRAHTEALNITQQQTQIINTQMLMQGALVPAALLIAGYAVCLLLQRKITKESVEKGANEKIATHPSLSRAQALAALSAVAFIVALLVAVASGLMFAVEAAATASIATLIYALLTRALNIVAWKEVLDEALALSGALFALLLGATTFSLVFRSLGTDAWLSSHITQAPLSPCLLVATVMAFIALCALALDAFEIVFVIVPIVMPPLLQVMPNAAWIAVLTLLVVQLSYVLPPLGLALLLVRQRANESLSLRVWVRMLAPFVLVQLMVIALVCVMPSLVSSPNVDPRLRSDMNIDGQTTKQLTEEEIINTMRETKQRE